MSSKLNNCFINVKPIIYNVCLILIIYQIILTPSIYTSPESNTTQLKNLASNEKEVIAKPIDSEYEISNDLKEIDSRKINQVADVIKDDFQIPFTGFIENIGQKQNRKIDLYYTTKNTFIGFGKSEISFFHYNTKNSEKNSAFTLTFLDSKITNPQGRLKLTHATNYFIGNQQFSNIASWNEVWYYEIYPNIDLRYYVSQNTLKYDFIVKPTGDPTQIKSKIEGNGIFTVITPKSVSIFSEYDNQVPIFTDMASKVYQENNIQIKSGFQDLTGSDDTYGFFFEPYDTSMVLIIDPIWLGFSTYLGGNGDDRGNDIVVDDSNNIYVTGQTQSTNFPTTAQALNQTKNGGTWDSFVIKLNNSGNEIIYSTYIGGSNDDFAEAIELDTDGNVYLTGYTSSSDFPRVNAIQIGLEGGFDAFVLKLDPTGSNLIFSTYLGGDSNDRAYDLAVDAKSSVYLTGETSSVDFDTTPGVL
ncbi:MAG: DUF7948 domain-containing protein, partial [Candidatus Kariarchaeaceae archaeon]